MSVNIIVAKDLNNGIGKDGDLLFRSSKDLTRFKELTTGHIVIMGSKTWESLPASKRPLPNRRNVIVSRRKGYPNDGAFWVEHDLEKAIKLYKDSGEQEKDLWVIGGHSVYEKALPYADNLYITQRYTAVDGADTFFPPFGDDFSVTSIEKFKEDEVDYAFIKMERRK